MTSKGYIEIGSHWVVCRGDYYRLELDIPPGDKVYVKSSNPYESHALAVLLLEDFEEMLAVFGYVKKEEK